MVKKVKGLTKDGHRSNNSSLKTDPGVKFKRSLYIYALPSQVKTLLLEMTPNWEGGLGAARGLTPAWSWDDLRLESLLRAQSGGPSGDHNLGAKSSSQTGFHWFRYFLKKYIVIDI